MTKYLLADREMNGAFDSDFYAVFWDTETQSIRSEEYGSTRYYSPRVAPTDEYLREVPAYCMKQAKSYLFARMYERIQEDDRTEVEEPSDVDRGDFLETLESGTFTDRETGQSVTYEAGEQGEVIWRGAFGTFYRNGYNRVGRHNLRVGLRFPDGRVVFIALKKCKRARPLLDDDAISRRAQSYVDAGAFHILFSHAGFIQI